MKKATLAVIVTFLVFIFSSHRTKVHDEGMFLLSDLSNIDLGKAGLKISLKELYNPGGISLVDAIVRVGGCTGSFVSKDGLIITNHHCAFGFVQAISSSRNNYIRDGFLAKTTAEEVQAKGLVCKITMSYEDVSAKVLNGTQEISDPNERMKQIIRNTRLVTEYENQMNKGLQCEISEMFTGRSYIVFRYKLLKDVRIVYVPARSIGEYGGERDNWVWPRHSGDFAFLRAYVARDGSPADYSSANVPYQPAKFLKINPNGVRENEFVFVLGYPGRTYRHQPAAFYEYHENEMLKYVSDIFDWQINKMEELGKDNDSIQIRYAGRIKSLSNASKNYKGKLQGFRRAGLTKKKHQEENQLEAFVKADPKMRDQFGNVIPRLNTLYGEIMKYASRNLWYDYIYNMTPEFQTASMIESYSRAYHELHSDSAKIEFVKRNKQKIRENFYRLINQYNPVYEKAAMKKMLEDAKKFNPDNEIEFVKKIYSDVKDDKALVQKIDKLYRKTKLNDMKAIGKLIDVNLPGLFKLNDPMIGLTASLNLEIGFHDDEDKRRDNEINLLMAKYVEMKSVWKDKRFVPDANSTLRFTYGYVKGFSPNDAEYCKPISTLTGVIEKEDGKDYELLQVIRDLYASKDFGPYALPDSSDIPVDFLYNLDTSGGNSGSPVLNANGELVGVNFDRSYTATINDYAWNESYSRSIGVDVRYVLWVLQKVAHANFLVQEMGLPAN